MFAADAIVVPLGTRFGDEAANEAFCASPNLPRFGPWDVKGDIKVKVESPADGDDDGGDDDD